MAHTPAHLDSSIIFQRTSGTLKSCGSGLKAALSMMATLMLCQAGFTHAVNQDWPFLARVPNSNLLLVAGETIDTTSAPSLLQQGTRRESYFNATFAQYYVQLKNDADVSKLHEVRVLFPHRACCRGMLILSSNPAFVMVCCFILQAIGGGFKSYVPNLSLIHI